MFPFPLYKLFVFRVFSSLHGVAASSLVGLYDLVLVCREPARQKKRRNSFCHLPFCQILPCRITCILVLACAFGTARPRSSAPRSFRNLVSLRNPSDQSLAFLSFCDSAEFLSKTPTPLSTLQCYSVNARDVHDESTVDSLLCLLLDFLGNALQHASTNTKCLVRSLILEAYLALNTIFDL